MQNTGVLYPPFCKFFEKFFISGTHLLQRHPFWKIILSYIMQKSPLLYPPFYKISRYCFICPNLHHTWQRIMQNLTHFWHIKLQNTCIMAKIRMVMLFVRDLYLKQVLCENNVKGYPLFGNFEHFMSSFYLRI